VSKRRNKQPRRTPRDAPWTPFYQCDHYTDGAGNKTALPTGAVYLRNNHYQVDLRVMESKEPFGRVVWLSIKRNDRKTIHDWRDLQRIKTEVLGAEIEAIELYPAESRHVDTSNQYCLWCFMDGYRFPYGYQERLLMDKDRGDGPPELSLSQQRPWRYHERPDDVLSMGEVMRQYVKDKDFGARVDGLPATTKEAGDGKGAVEEVQRVRGSKTRGLVRQTQEREGRLPGDVQEVPRRNEGKGQAEAQDVARAEGHAREQDD